VRADVKTNFAASPPFFKFPSWLFQAFAKARDWIYHASIQVNANVIAEILSWGRGHR